LPDEEKPQMIKNKIKKMPKENRELFKYLIEFLAQVSCPAKKFMGDP
jgi:hypothetical protein